MAPFYYTEDDILLKSQLKNLEFQKDKTFEVIIPDPHYKKRGYLESFVKNLSYNVVHYPYESNLQTPKSFDYGILNDASLMASSNKLVIFQDWRFCNVQLVQILKKFNNSWFIGFEWQGYENTTPSGKKLYEEGVIPSFSCELTHTNTFHNSSWGNYCINKNLWLEINGIDEVATNTRHYADLDMNARLSKCYASKGWVPHIPMVKNGMFRLQHNKGQLFGNSHVPLDYEVNSSHLSCCFVNTGGMNDKQFTHYAFQKIQSGDFIKLYETPYSESFKRHNGNPALDSSLCTLGFQCRKCGVIAETPHWYEKSPDARIASMIGKGVGNIKLGRNLSNISVELNNQSFEKKVEILRSSWYDPKFLS